MEVATKNQKVLEKFDFVVLCRLRTSRSKAPQPRKGSLGSSFRMMTVQMPQSDSARNVSARKSQRRFGRISSGMIIAATQNCAKLAN